LVLFLAGGVLVIWSSKSALPPEPTYNGKALSIWLRDLDYSHRPADQIASNAVAQIGTNALPYLAPMLRAHDSYLKVHMFSLLQKQSYWKVSFTPAKELRERASRGCRVLHQHAAQYVPELTLMLDSPDRATAWCGLVALMDVQPRAEWAAILDKALTNGSPQVRWVSASHLGTLGNASSNSLPRLVSCLTDSNANVRRDARAALSKIERDETRLIPLVVAQLTRADAANRVFLLQALENLSKDSKQIEPTLLRYRDDPDPSVRLQAEAALKRIRRANEF
jgi:hypothetical protein